MIKFRQKEFIAPLALLGSTKTMGALTALSIGQGVKSAKDQAEYAEQQAEQNAQITKALNRVAKAAENNPQVAQQAADIMSQRQYALISPGIIKGAKGLVKDAKPLLWNKGTKKFLKNGLVFGGTMGVASYGIDKAIQHDAKKIGMPLGQPVQEERQFAIPTGSIMKGLGKGLKSTGKFLNNNKGTIIGASSMAAIPAIGYLSERQQFKDQIASTDQAKQKQYAAIGGVMKFVRSQAGNIGKGAKNLWGSTKSTFKPIMTHPGQTILGTANKFASFGGFGRKEVAKFGQDLHAAGMKSGNTWTQKVGKFIVDNPKTSLLATLPAASAATKVSYDASEKLVRKTAGALDKDAFAYEKSKNQVIQ